MKTFISNRVKIAPSKSVYKVDGSFVHFVPTFSFYNVICTVAEYEETANITDGGRSVTQSVTLAFEATPEQITRLTNGCVIALRSDAGKTIIVGSPEIPAMPRSVKNLGDHMQATYTCVAPDFQL